MNVDLDCSAKLASDVKGPKVVRSYGSIGFAMFQPINGMGMVNRIQTNL
ncbi:hypothetical protein [Litchfieldia alkalitelluris]|nr:hypothetical protein [Litchfieldia alkalitelluris]